MEDLTKPEIRVLLLDCINNYLGHLEYVKKNKEKYELNLYVSSSLDNDIEKLELIRMKLLCVEMEKEKSKKLERGKKI